MSKRTVFITGAAAGIGKSVALRMAREGFRVAAFDIDAAGIERLQSELPSDAITGILDVRDADQWQTALDTVSAATGGTLDVLINNAGILRSGKLQEIPLADQQLVVEVNVFSVLNGCYLAYPLLKATRGAHVVNMASASAIYGQAELATYSATKFAVRGYSEALDIEWADDDIAVSAIWPLFVQTAMTDDMDIASSRKLGIKLTADDVASEILKAVNGRSTRVHRGVGLQSKVMMASSNVSPSRIVRLLNRNIAKSR